MCPQGGRLLEMNLMAAPQVADDIMADDKFTQEPAHPDRRQGHELHQPLRLNNYDMSDIANHRRLGADEKALVIFKKAELHREAAKALIDYISSIERATELAEALRGERGLGDVQQQ